MRCWSGCFTGGAAVDAGGGDMAPSSGAAVSSDGEREILPLPLPSSFVFSFSVSFTSGCPFVLLVLFLKNFPSLVSSFPLIFPFSFYFTPLFSVTFLFVPPPVLALGVIYRAKGAGLFIVAHGERGSAGCLASGRGWQGAAPLVSHHQRHGASGLGRACGKREATNLKKKKTKIFFLPLLHVQRKKKEEQCRLK